MAQSTSFQVVSGNSSPAGNSILPLGDSILASWIRSVCQTLRGYGLRPEALMERSGLDETLLTVPEARYPAMQVRRFWEMAISATGDNLVGLRCGYELQCSSLHGLGLAIITSHSLAQVLELTARYCKVISSTMDMSLSHNGQGDTLTIGTLHDTEARHSAVLMILAFLLRQANSLSQHRVEPSHVCLRYPQVSAADQKRLDEYFHCPVDTSGKERDCISFTYSDIMEPYAGANATLREANERVVIQYLNRVRSSSFAARVEEEVQDAFLTGRSARISDVAKRLNLSSRTLQRRLEVEGVTFAELLDRRRRQMAHDNLAHTENSITEIAYSLGFSDPSNFSRTCYRWFGAAPAAYRRRIRQIPT